MKAAKISDIKKELINYSQKELTDICLNLAKFKIENKELLNYILFESHNKEIYVQGIKNEIDNEFDNINTSSFYLIKKSVRKILKSVKKYIKYIKDKETEVDLLIYFCFTLKSKIPYFSESIALHNIYLRQVESIKKTITFLHEDLQFDYINEIDDKFFNKKIR